MAKETTIFDKSKLYDEQIAPLVKDVIAHCAMYRIPCYFSACVANTKTESDYRNEGVLCGSTGIHLTDDRITGHLNVSLGFRTSPPTESPEIAYDDSDPDFSDLLMSGIPVEPVNQAAE